MKLIQRWQCKHRGYHNYFTNDYGRTMTCADCDKRWSMKIQRIIRPMWIRGIQIDYNGLDMRRYVVLTVKLHLDEWLVAPKWYTPLKLLFIAQESFYKLRNKVFQFAWRRGWIAPVEGQQITLQTVYQWWKAAR